MIGVYFRTTMTPEQYKDLDEELRKSNPPMAGLKMHSCFGEEDGVAIFDVWESKEEFEAFAAVLGPVAETMGVEKVEPMLVPMVAFQVGPSPA